MIRISICFASSWQTLAKKRRLVSNDAKNLRANGIVKIMSATCRVEPCVICQNTVPKADRRVAVEFVSSIEVGQVRRKQLCCPLTRDYI